MMNPEFAGVVALVTGGASGIGRATADRLQQHGAQVAVFDLAPNDLPEGMTGYAGDVGDRASVDDAVAAIVAEHGQLDVLVNNAGIGAQGTVEDNDDTEWQHVLDINVVGMARTARAALPHLRRSSRASIVNVSSIAAHAGLPDRVLYSASKGAVQAMTLAMAADHVREGVRVNAVCPGTADTPWIQRLLAKADDPTRERDALAARQPMGRLVSEDEVAHAVCALASPAASATTGTVMSVDGGMLGLRPRPHQ